MEIWIIVYCVDDNFMMNYDKIYSMLVGVNCVVWSNDSCKMSCKVYM